MPQGVMPSGTVTLLFSDIEGSTKLWERYPEQMRNSLARHDALMREAIESANGYVFKTVGDAFCAAFTTAPEAVEAVLVAQRALNAEPWPAETPIKVRMALHTGAVESRESDYFGPPLNRVARLLSTGHGGQTILSQTTYDLVRDYVPDRVTLREMGEHRLKDLGRPESVFQILHPDLPDDFPPLRSLDNPDLKHNLPRQVTSFVGREQQISEVQALLEKTRLLTLTGSGGSGKTRLALQVAADMLDGSGDGAWLVELAPLTEPGLVPQTVATVLGLKVDSGNPILQTLTDYLKNKHLLLVLDNCEHVLDASAKLADAIMRTCPRVLILATSREAMGIAGETSYRVPSLSSPDPAKPQTPESLSVYETVQLFIERAAQVQVDFIVTNENAPALAFICHRLDGIPLAIELAAARVRSLSVEEINNKLDQRFRLLTGGSRTALPRQQTLRSLIDWSYDLLNEAEKLLLQRLSVFAGGWTLEAAEQICSGGPVEDWEMLDLLTSLCDKSLVVCEQKGGVTRYRLLESVTEYARDRLTELGESDDIIGRCRQFFLALAQTAEPLLREGDQALWLERLELEHDNLRKAFDWADDHVSLEIAAAIWSFWWMKGYSAEATHLLNRVLNSPLNAAPTKARALCLNAAGVLASNTRIGGAAQPYYSEALEVFRALGDRAGTARVLHNMGCDREQMGDLASARELLEESLETHRQIGEPNGIGQALLALGITLHYLGEHDPAMKLLTESERIFREVGNVWRIAWALSNVGMVCVAKGDFQRARSVFVESIEARQRIGDKQGLADSIYSFAGLAFGSGEFERASKLAGAQDRLREEACLPMTANEARVFNEQVAQARTVIGTERCDAAWRAGRAMNPEQAIELATRESGACRGTS